MQKELLICAIIIGLIKEFVFTICQIIFRKKFFIWKTNGNKTVALTFDDGPDQDYTGKILDVLKKYSIKATFFLIGEKVKQYPGIAQRIFDNGHSIGNHTYTHKNLRRLTSLEIEDEFIKTQRAIEDITGCSPNIMRPPRGRFNLKTIRIARKAGLTTIMWSKSAKDYKMKGQKFILKKINLKTITERDIILFHDNNKYTLESLPYIISELKDNGFVFVKLGI